MAMQVREITRQAWEALRAAGEVPSVRKVYARVGGAYTTVVAECRVLRAETAQLLPVPSVFSPGMRAALAAVVHEIRTNPTYAHNLKVRLAVMEYGDGGPLARLVDVIAQGE